MTEPHPTPTDVLGEFAPDLEKAIAKGFQMAEALVGRDQVLAWATSLGRKIAGKVAPFDPLGTFKKQGGDLAADEINSLLSL